MRRVLPWPNRRAQKRLCDRALRRGRGDKHGHEPQRAGTLRPDRPHPFCFQGFALGQSAATASRCVPVSLTGVVCLLRRGRPTAVPIVSGPEVTSWPRAGTGVTCTQRAVRRPVDFQPCSILGAGMSPIPRVQSPSGAKPRVFLIDDNRQFLDALSTMLIDDFEVVGAATDARQALETMGDTSPDIVILDVEMPGVDGFETLRALKQSPLRATPTVFLSMHDADEFVTEAFRCGAQGYVVKSRVSRDLVSALDQAL